jgi:hypothetical protein
VAFVAVKNRNTTISGNWTIDGLDNLGSSGNDLTQGLFYGGNLSTAQFNLQGEINDPDEQINLREDHHLGPILLTGECGESAGVSLSIQSGNPLDLISSFPADVTCQTEDLLAHPPDG